MPSEIHEGLRRHAAETYPVEACGFLVGRAQDGAGIVEEAPRASNLLGIAGREGFRIAPREFLALEDRLRDSPRRILGFYHSHPDGAGAPSPLDTANVWPDYVYLVVAAPNGAPGEVTAWRRMAPSSSLEPVDIVVRPRWPPSHPHANR